MAFFPRNIQYCVYVENYTFYNHSLNPPVLQSSNTVNPATFPGPGRPTSLADPEDVDQPGGEEVDGRGRHVGPVHRPDQLGQAELPLHV